VVFQNHSLLPWLTCFDNVHLAVERVFAARPAKARPAEGARRWPRWTWWAWGTPRHKRPHEISGGMKQRVGIARALAMEPKVLLMDEPFGALDALTRAHLQDELLKIVAHAPAQHVVMVTHDVDEAVLLSDRIVMMTNGPAATIGEILTRGPAAPARPHRAGRGRGATCTAARRCSTSSTPATATSRRPRRMKPATTAPRCAKDSSWSATAWPACARSRSC
jgi:nitrate/nitrite transport system ATP-binding protein